MSLEYSSAKDRLLEVASKHGIHPSVSHFNGTTAGLMGSVPELFQYVTMPEVPRKFLVFEGTYASQPAFIKILLHANRHDLRTQLQREALANIELAEPAKGLIPELLDVIDEPESGFLAIIYKKLPDEFNVLQVPFFPEAVSAAGLPELHRIIQHLDRWTEPRNSTYYPSKRMLAFSGNPLKAKEYYPESSIKGLSGMTTSCYKVEFRKLLNDPHYYLVREDIKTGSHIQQAFKLLWDSSNDILFTAALDRLSRSDHNFEHGYVFVHNDLGPQNIMVSKQNTIFLDLENVTIAANGVLGQTADAAHLVSRAWYNQYWQEGIIDSMRDKSTPLQLAFNTNLILEALRRLTRPIGYYANENINGQPTFHPVMEEYSLARYYANMHLLDSACTNLQSLLNS